MAWLFLFTAGVFEIAFATALKASEGFTRLWPTVAFLAFSIISFILLSRAIVYIPVGTAYAVWTGIGAAGTAVVGILIYNEPATALRLFFLAMLIASIIGLRLTFAE